MNKDAIVLFFENDLDNNENSQAFVNSLQKHGWKHCNVGDGVKWCGFKTKIQGYHEALQAINTTSPEQLVVLSDARDCFCVRSCKTFADSLNRLAHFDLQKQILISAEMFLLGHMEWDNAKVAKALSEDPNYFWQGVPLTNFWSNHTDITNQSILRKYINSGLILGKAKHLLAAFQWIKDNQFEDDQLGLCHYANNFPAKVALDFDAEILHTTTFGTCGGLYDDSQKYDAPTIAELIGQHSYFLHIPGISGSKGQRHLYQMVKQFLQHSFATMCSIYNVKPPDSLNYNYFVKN